MHANSKTRQHVKENVVKSLTLKSFLLAEAEQAYQDFQSYQDWKVAAKKLGCVIVPRHQENRTLAMQQGTVCGEFENGDETGWLMNYDEVEHVPAAHEEMPQENEEQTSQVAAKWVQEHPQQISHIGRFVDKGDERSAYQFLRGEIQDENLLWAVLGQLFGSAQDEEQSREATQAEWGERDVHHTNDPVGDYDAIEGEEDDRAATWAMFTQRQDHGIEGEECEECGMHPCACNRDNQNEICPECESSPCLCSPGMNMPQDRHGMMKFESVQEQSMDNYKSMAGSFLASLLKINEEEIGGGNGAHVAKTDYYSPADVGDQKQLRQLGKPQNVGQATMGKQTKSSVKGDSGSAPKNNPKVALTNDHDHDESDEGGEDEENSMKSMSKKAPPFQKKSAAPARKPPMKSGSDKMEKSGPWKSHKNG